jgi:hypothetical protein
MANRSLSTRIGGIASVGLVSLLSGCAPDSKVVRPSGVPTGATYLPTGIVGGWWQRCTISAAHQPPHCVIWNRGGLVLYDEEFLPADQGSLPTEAELQIPATTWFSGPDRICLADGRVLFPRSRFGELKSWLDELFKGKRINCAEPAIRY